MLHICHSYCTMNVYFVKSNLACVFQMETLLIQKPFERCIRKHSFSTAQSNYRQERLSIHSANCRENESKINRKELKLIMLKANSSKIKQLGTLSKYQSPHVSWVWISVSPATLSLPVSATECMISYKKHDTILLSLYNSRCHL